MSRKEYRVIGPPGTGKTSWVVRQVEQWRQKYGRDEILLASFTTTAAREIKRRKIDLDEKNLGTLHAICYRMLGKPELAEAKVSEFNAWTLQHHGPEFQLSARSGSSFSDDFGMSSDVPEEEASGDVLLRVTQTHRARLEPQEMWSDQSRRFFFLWKEWKAVAGYYDFTDLIEVCLDSFGAPAGVKIACYDEVQDFSPLELAVVRKWAHDLEGVVLVGDPDQSIFHFKGASPRAFLEPELPPESYRVLSQSWRVPKAVHAMASNWIGRSSWRYPFEYTPKNAEGVVERRDGSGWLSLKQPDLIVREIVAHNAAGKVCMVLASCAYHLQATLRELKRVGVPFHNPFVSRGDWNPLRGGPEIVQAFLETPRPDLFGGEILDGFDEAKRWWHPKTMWRWAQHIKAAGVFVRGGKEVLRARAEESKKHTHGLELFEISELFTPEALARMLECLKTDKPWEWLRDHLLPEPRKRMDYAFQICDRSGVRALTDKPKVIVGTIHSVKGAEAEVVYLSPDLSRRGYEEWMGMPEQRDVVRRVFYVGMTRSSERLVLLGRSEKVAFIEWDA
jgi:DNA helicase-2/ATP-dependent DNA helicase PcrA